MKKALSTSILAALFASGSLVAQDVDNQASIYGGLGLGRYGTSLQLDDGTGFFIGGEAPISERVSLALEHYRLDADRLYSPGEVDTDYTRLGANIHLDKLGAWQPYLALGIGDMEYTDNSSDDNVFALDMGAGVKRSITDNLFFRGDLKVLRGDDSIQNLLIGLGVGYAFGNASSPAPAPSMGPVDSDGDGVYDDRDACANTPAGVEVDSRGCELDSDRDGVFDSNDECPNTPTTLAVDARGCPINEVVEHRIELLVNFDFDKSVIKPEFDSEIEDFANFMKTWSNSETVIEGHTDSDGTDEYNQGLSERRANAVMNELINEYDISGSRLDAVGYGESRPRATNATDAGRAENRRIEAEITVEEERQRQR